MEEEREAFEKDQTLKYPSKERIAKVGRRGAEDAVMEKGGGGSDTSHQRQHLTVSPSPHETRSLLPPSTPRPVTDEP